jgi:peroxiredoxin
MMKSALRKYLIPLMVVIGLLLSVFAFNLFGRRDHSDIERKLAVEAESYKEQRLPEVPLIELKSGSDYSEQLKDKDVLLVFATTGCGACTGELEVIAQNASEINPQLKIYAVMFEDKATVEQYVQKHNLNFPILLDTSGTLYKKLHLKYFPTSFKLKDGTIKAAWFGLPDDKKEFLKMANL